MQHFLKKKLVVVTTDRSVSKKLRPLGVLAVLHCCSSTGSSVADSMQSDRQPEAGVVWLEFKPFSVEQRGRVPRTSDSSTRRLYYNWVVGHNVTFGHLDWFSQSKNLHTQLIIPLPDSVLFVISKGVNTTVKISSLFSLQENSAQQTRQIRRIRDLGSLIRGLRFVLRRNSVSAWALNAVACIAMMQHTLEQLLHLITHWA